MLYASYVTISKHVSMVIYRVFTYNDKEFTDRLWSVKILSHRKHEFDHLYIQISIEYRLSSSRFLKRMIGAIK